MSRKARIRKHAEKYLNLSEVEQKLRRCAFKKPPPTGSRGGVSGIQEQRLKKKKKKKKLHQRTVSSPPRLKPCLICGDAEKKETGAERVSGEEGDSTGRVAMEIGGLPGSSL